MTAIAAIVTNEGHIIMGGDSAGTSYDFSQTIRKDPKVFHNKKFLIGFTSSYRMGQILRYSFKPPRHLKKVDTDTYMRTVFIDAVRSALKDGGYTHIQNNTEAGGLFLVGYRSRIFAIEPDFQVGEPINNYFAVGCGSDLCLGSFASTKFPKDYIPTHEDYSNRVLLALRAAEEHSAGVQGPMILEELKAKK